MREMQERVFESRDAQYLLIKSLPASGESTRDKHNEVDYILDAIDEVVKQDEDTGVIFIKRHSDATLLKVADLVEDTPKER